MDARESAWPCAITPPLGPKGQTSCEQGVCVSMCLPRVSYIYTVIAPGHAKNTPSMLWYRACQERLQLHFVFIEFFYPPHPVMLRWARPAHHDAVFTFLPSCFLSHRSKGWSILYYLYEVDGLHYKQHVNNKSCMQPYIYIYIYWVMSLVSLSERH